MAIIERDVILQGKTESGQPTLDFPITRLSNIEASSDIKSKPEAGDYLPIIDGQDDGMKMVPVETLLPKEDNYVRSNKNFLRNAIFKHPVNRRGKKEYLCNKYTGPIPSTVDLWGTTASDELPLKVIISEENHCLIIQTKHYIHFLQQIMNYDELVGKNITISALIDPNITAHVRLGVCDHNKVDHISNIFNYKEFTNSQPGIQLISYTFQASAIQHDLIYAFIQPVNVEAQETEVSVKLYGMKVELGDTQTLAKMNSDGVWELIDDPDYAEEYAYCEKYDLDDYSFVGDYHVNENLIPNWDFRHPMNSQGKTEYGNYNMPSNPLECSWDLSSIDGWVIHSKGDMITIKNGYINLKGFHVNFGNDLNLFPGLTSRAKFKYCPYTNGQTVTLSLLCKIHKISTSDLTTENSVGIQIANDTKSDYSITVYEDLKYETLSLITGTFNIPSTWDKNDLVRYTIFSYYDIDIDIYAAKVELGSVSTLAHLNSNGQYVIHNTKSNLVEQILVNEFSKYDGEYYPVGKSNPNLLDNWYLIDPINQRNQPEYIGKASIQCGFDRWYHYSAGGATFTKSIDGILVDSTSSNSTCGFIQIIEADRLIAGETYTLSALVKIIEEGDNEGSLQSKIALSYGSDRSSDITGSSFLPCGPTNDYILHSYTFKLNDPSNGLYNFRIRAAAQPNGVKFLLKAMKLERGCQQTLARKIGDSWVLNDPPPNKALELQKCQRYLQRFCGRITSQGFYTKDKIIYPISLACSMAKKPKLIYTDLVVEKTAGGFVEGFTFEVDPLYDYDSYSLNISIAANKLDHGFSENTVLNARSMILLSAE